MNKLLKTITIKKEVLTVHFAGYDVCGYERYEYRDTHGVPGYFTRYRRENK